MIDGRFGSKMFLMMIRPIAEEAVKKGEKQIDRWKRKNVPNSRLALIVVRGLVKS